MKKIKILCICCVVLTSFFFYSCSQSDDNDTMSIEGRIDKFISDLNSNPGNVWTNCHSGASKYNQAKPAKYWTQQFGTDKISLENISISGSTVTADVDGGNYVGLTITFNMQEDGTDNWKIKKITVGSTTVFD